MPSQFNRLIAEAEGGLLALHLAVFTATAAMIRSQGKSPADEEQLFEALRISLERQCKQQVMQPLILAKRQEGASEEQIDDFTKSYLDGIRLHVLMIQKFALNRPTGQPGGTR